LKNLIVILFILGGASLSALEPSGAVSTGVKYNSNIEKMYLIDRVITFLDKNKDITTLDDIVALKRENVDSLFVALNGDISFIHKNSLFSYSVSADVSMENREYSKLNQYAEYGFFYSKSESFSFDISLLGHYAAENFRSFQHLYLDFYLYLNLYYDLNDYFSLFTVLKGAYYKNIDSEYSFKNDVITLKSKKLDYLNGPVGGVEIGTYVYPSGKKNYLKQSLGADLYLFRNNSYNIIPNEKVDRLLYGNVNIKNKYLKMFFKFETVWNSNFLKFIVKAEYSKFIWLERDEWKEIGQNKMRAESIVTISPSLYIPITDFLEISALYEFKFTESNMGESKFDYIDNDNTEHVAALSLTYFINASK